MNPSVRALKVQATIEEAFTSKNGRELQCDVRISSPKVAGEFPSFGDLKLTVVTVTIWGSTANNHPRKATFEEQHRVHEILAAEFWNEPHAASIQIIG